MDSELAAPLMGISMLDQSPSSSSPTKSPQQADPRSPTSARRLGDNPRSPASPGNRSGIVFGSPRREKSSRSSTPTLANPFADMPSSSQSSPQNETGLKELLMPARTLEFQKHSPPSYSNPPGSVYTVPQTDQKDVAWSSERSYEALDEEDEEDALASHEDHEQLVEKMASPDAKIKNKRRQTRGGCMSWLSNPYVKYPAALLAAIILIAGLFVGFLIVSFRHPTLDWQSNLSNTEVGASTAGFNFTSTAHMDFRNPNFWGLTMTELDLTAKYNQSQIIGHGMQGGFSLPLGTRKSRNPALQMQMDFAYIAANDPGNSVLKFLWAACRTDQNLPLTLSATGKFKIAGLITIPLKLTNSNAYLECDTVLTKLTFQTLQTLQVSVSTLDSYK